MNTLDELLRCGSDSLETPEEKAERLERERVMRDRAAQWRIAWSRRLGEALAQGKLVALLTNGMLGRSMIVEIRDTEIPPF